MARWISVVLGLLVLSLPWFLPEAPTARLAAREAGSLLGVHLNPTAEKEDGLGPTLFDELVETYGDTLPLRGLRFDSEAGTDPQFEDIYEARTSLVRSLRTLASSQRHENFKVLGEQTPEQIGLTVHVRYQDGMLIGQFDGPDGKRWNRETKVTLPRKSSLWPPLIAVAIAIVLRRPLTALTMGVFVGAVLMHPELSFAASLVAGVKDFFALYFWKQFVDPERAYIIGFVVLMLAMVGVLTRSGAIRGMMDAIAKRADSRRGTQISTYLMGLAIFFDDYANTILVGSTMRPLTDKYKVAREKLAYLVDSTAAPVAGLSVFSTWIAFEVSTYNAQLPAAGLKASDGYEIFLQSVPYSFYCIFTLVFVGAIAWSGRDFGPMRKAEERAASGGGLLAPDGQPMVGDEATNMEPHPNATPKLSRALLALGAFLGATLLMIAYGDGQTNLFGLGLGQADSPFFDLSKLSSIKGITSILYEGSGSYPLFIGSAAGLLVATIGAFRTGLDAKDVVDAAWTTLRSMLVAFALLYLAWMIGDVTKQLHTAGYLTAFVGDRIPPFLFPTGLFFLSGLMAFATGSSWSTMSIVLPIAVPLAYQLGLTSELAEAATESGRLLMTISIGSVLSGAIFGDHCSPISDTTIMSSIATASDHIDHVRTQAPYAITVMVISVSCGYLPAATGVSPWICLVGGCFMCVAVVFGVGRKTVAV